MINTICADILLGVIMGDALGVPVEFKSREQLRREPVTDLLGYGSHNQPAGTFSDDGSLTCCLAEALTKRFSLSLIADLFIEWLFHNYWTARGDLFDVGIATNHAIRRLQQGVVPEMAGGREASDNGNGSLMRILPLLAYIHNKPVEERFRITSQVSSLTHGHIRSVIACFYYLEFARTLAAGTDKFQAYQRMQQEVSQFLEDAFITPGEIEIYRRLLKESITDYEESDIQSGGYVVQTLEASIWCLLTTSSYEAAVLKAVNLGSDTDTTAAVTGGLAGILYGHASIPNKWLQQLARKKDIQKLAHRLQKVWDKK